jgi:hypothetical protein
MPIGRYRSLMKEKRRRGMLRFNYLLAPILIRQFQSTAGTFGQDLNTAPFSSFRVASKAHP